MNSIAKRQTKKPSKHCLSKPKTHPPPKRKKQTHHQKRQMQNNKPPKIPIQTLPHPLHPNQKHTPIQKTPKTTTNNKHTQTPNRKKRHTKHRTPNRPPQRHHSKPPRRHGRTRHRSKRIFYEGSIGLSQYECDEIWTFIKKKKRRLSEATKLNLKAVTATYTPL